MLVGIVAAGCGGGPDAAAPPAAKSDEVTPTAAEPIELPEAVDFNRHVAPIIFANCSVCHRPQGSAPFDLLAYEDARARADRLAEVTSARLMPPWQPEPGWGVFRGERRLSDRQIALIRRWADDGAPEGDPGALVAAPPIVDGWQLGEPDLVVEMPETYTLPAEGIDVFRNFVLPVPLAQRRYVRSIDLRPGTPRVVHHASMAIDETLTSRRLDNDDPGPGYYHGMEFSEAHSPDGHFLGWTPGKVPFEGSDELSWRLDRGTDLVLQLHMLPTGKPEPIRASVGLYFADEPATRAALMLRLGSKTMDIPAGESAYVIEDEYRLPVDVDVLSVYPHAHYLATDMRATATLPDGSERRLLWIRDWDFNWQDEYRYDEPVALPRGTVLRMRYTYDNSDANPQNPSQPPQRVRFGPLSSDEMGDLWVQVLPRSGRDRAALAADFGAKEAAANVAAYRFAVEADPDDAQAHYNLGTALQGQDRHGDAVEHFLEALQLDPSHAPSHYNLGEAYLAGGDAERGMDHYRRALEIKPDYVEARVNLGVALASLGRVGEAIIEFNEALRTKPDDAEANNNLAVALLNIGRIDVARRHLEQALQTDPDHPHANNNAGLLLLAEDDAEQAAVRFRRALQSDRRYGDAYNNLGLALGMLGRFEEAAAAFRSAVGIRPDDAEARDNLGMALEQLGELDAAIEQYREAVRLQPEWEKARADLERALAKRERPPP